MTNKIRDVQAIINERAEKKLNEDVALMCRQIQQMPLLRNMHDGQQPRVYIQKLSAKPGTEMTDPPVYQNYTLPDLFNGEVNRNGDFSGSLWIKNLREKWITEYIQRETVDFFNRVDQLQNDIQNLMDAKSETDAY